MTSYHQDHNNILSEGEGGSMDSIVENPFADGAHQDVAIRNNTKEKNQYTGANNALSLDQLSFFQTLSTTKQSGSDSNDGLSYYSQSYQHEDDSSKYNHNNHFAAKSSTAEERLQQQLRETYNMINEGSTKLSNHENSKDMSLNHDKNRSKWSQNGNIPRVAQHPSIHSYSSNNSSVAYSTDRVPTVSQIGLPEAVMRLRGINLGLCGTSAIFGILSLATFLLTLNLRKLIMAIYLSFFSLLVCGYESHITFLNDRIKDNFGFIYNSKLRACFIFLLSTICFQVGGIGLLVGFGMLSNGAFHFYIIYKYGSLELEDQQRIVGSEDITSILVKKVGRQQPSWTTIHDKNAAVSSMSYQSESEVLINGRGGYSVIQ